MSNVFNTKKTIVTGIVVLLLLLMQIESVAGGDWEVRTQLPPKRIGFATAVVGHKVYLIGGTGDIGKGWELFPDVVVYDTGFRAVTAKGRLSTIWGELKTEPQRQYQRH